MRLSAAAAARAPGRPSLRPPLHGGPEALSTRARTVIADLSGPRPARFFAELGFNWLVVAGAIALGVGGHNPFVSALCVAVIATRQMVFGLLLHEQVHRLGLRTKHGDWIVNVLAVFPLFATTVEDYAKVHLRHHKYFMTPLDPDFVRKAGAEWTFPAPWRRLARIVFLDITGMNTLQLIRGKTAPADAFEFERRLPTPSWLRIAFYVMLGTVLTWLHAWPAFLLYWILPLLTLTQLLVRWIAVVEHEYNVKDASVNQVTPLVELTWWQKLLLPDLNFAMHAYHHHHPGVSFSNLPKVHEIYKREGLVDCTAIFRGQGAYLKSLSGQPSIPAKDKSTGHAAP